MGHEQRLEEAVAPAGPGEGSLRGWHVLRDCPLGGPGGVVLPYALLHPGMGVALLDLAPHRTPGAEALLRQRLDATRFSAIFPGSLPVAHLVLPPERLPDLPQVLDAAFGRLPPLALAGGDSWVLSGIALTGVAVVAAPGILLFPMMDRSADRPVAIAIAPIAPEVAQTEAPLTETTGTLAPQPIPAPTPSPAAPSALPPVQEAAPPPRREARRPAPPAPPAALAPGPQYLDAARPMTARPRPDTMAAALPSRTSPEQELRNLVRCRRILAGIQSGSLPPEGELRFFDRFCQPE